MSIGYCITWQR